MQLGPVQCGVQVQTLGSEQVPPLAQVTSSHVAVGESGKTVTRIHGSSYYHSCISLPSILCHTGIFQRGLCRSLHWHREGCIQLCVLKSLDIHSVCSIGEVTLLACGSLPLSSVTGAHCWTCARASIFTLTGNYYREGGQHPLQVHTLSG